jgi:hypothetical protein
VGKNRKIPFLALILILLVFPLFLFAIKQNLDNRSSAAAADKLETENGILSSSGVAKRSDSSASGGEYIKFGELSIIAGPTAQKITGNSVEITWTLSEGATGQIEYGTTTNYGTLSAFENSFTYATHIQTLSNLTPGTTYNYRVISRNQAGQEVKSENKTFTTTTGSTTSPAPDAGANFPKSQTPPTGWTSYPAVPPRPAFLGQVKDPMFGGYAKRILEESTHWNTGSRDGGMSYPTNGSVFNSTDTRILIANNRRDYIDASNYKHLGRRDGLGNPIWSNRKDGDYPFTIWGLNQWPSALQGAAHFYKMNSETGVIQSVRDFSGTYEKLTALKDISDNDLAVFAGLHKSDKKWYVIVFDPIANKVISEKELINPRANQNLEPKGISISHSGDYYTVGWGYGYGYDTWGHAQAFYKTATHELIAWAGPGDYRFAHADFCTNTGGQDVWVVSGMYMYSFPDQIKQPKGTLLTPWDPNPPGNAWGYQHLGCHGPPGWVYGSAGLLSTWGYSSLFAPGVISRIKLDGSGEVQIWGHAHAISTGPNYVGDWTDPYASPSRRGDRVVFGSKWNSPDQPATNSSTHIYVYSMNP